MPCLPLMKWMKYDRGLWWWSPHHQDPLIRTSTPLCLWSSNEQRGVTQRIWNTLLRVSNITGECCWPHPLMRWIRHRWAHPSPVHPSQQPLSGRPFWVLQLNPHGPDTLSHALNLPAPHVDALRPAIPVVAVYPSTTNTTWELHFFTPTTAFSLMSSTDTQSLSYNVTTFYPQLNWYHLFYMYSHPPARSPSLQPHHPTHLGENFAPPLE